MSTPEEPPPLPLATIDVEQLTAFGQHNSYNLKFIVAEMTFYGVYIVLVSVALYTILNRQQKTTRTFLLAAALIATFSVTTFVCTADLIAIHTWVDMMLTDGSEPVLRNRVMRYNMWIDSTRISLAVDFLGSSADMGVLFLINDLLATWRAMAVWQRPSRAILVSVLCILIFSSFGLWIAFMGIETHLLDPISNIANSEVSAILGITSTVASIVSNLLATWMIGYVAYQYHRVEVSNGVKLGGAKILVLLAESGLVYALLQIIRLALNVSIVESTPFYGSLDTGWSIFQSASLVVTAMYPPALIIIIGYGYSIADTVQLNTISGSPGSNSEPRPRRRGPVHTLSNIVFNRSRGRSTTETGEFEGNGYDSGAQCHEPEVMSTKAPGEEDIREVAKKV